MYVCLPCAVLSHRARNMELSMHRSVSVLKFGGTSVGNGERIRRVAQIIFDIARNPEEAFPVVVVSAISGVTDHLIRLAGYLATGEREARQQAFIGLRQKHTETAQKAVRTPDLLTRLQSDLTTTLDALEEYITVQAEHEVSEEEQALRTATIASWGERLSVLLIAAAAEDLGLASQAVRQELIITAEPHVDSSNANNQASVVGADPLTEETRLHAQTLLLPLIEQGIVPIAPGFIGRTPSGTVTTLGRNGSDFSATVIGAALDCDEVSIYTDVDGVMSADPRLVKNARLLPLLTYAEAARLSWFGAKVLHPRTLIPMAHRNIPVRVRNTFRPQLRGTLVGPESQFRSGAGAITVRHNLALITVESTDLFGAPENAGQVFVLAARAGAAPVAICSSSGHHLAFLVEARAAASVTSVLEHDLDEWQVSARYGLAACACIGSGFTVDPMAPARAVGALAGERIPIITQGSSELGITLIVEERDSERALRSLHRDLIAPVIPLVRPDPTDKVRESRTRHKR